MVGTSIRQRPKEIRKRRTFGHWELDTIVSSRGKSKACAATGNTCFPRKELKIIDSTTIGLCLQKYRWAAFRKTKAGIKIHLRLVFANQEDVYPEEITITSAKSNDRTQMESLIDEIRAMYVFDRGYVD